MDKDIAYELFCFCNQRRAKEFNKWTSLPARVSEKEYEIQRQKVGAWAEISNWFYKMSTGEIEHDNNSIQGASAASRSATTTIGALHAVSQATEETA